MHLTQHSQSIKLRFLTFDDNQTGISVFFLGHSNVDFEFISNFSDDFTFLSNDLRMIFFRDFNLVTQSSFYSMKKKKKKSRTKNNKAAQVGLIPLQ